MARKRIISPEFLTSETVAALPFRTRLGWVALWMYADDYGRGRDNAALIKADSWPLDRSVSERKVAADLTLFEKSGMICRYLVSGQAFFHVLSWADWQKISHPARSPIPPCPAETRPNGHAGLRKVSEDFRDAAESFPAIEVKSIEEKLSGPAKARAAHTSALKGLAS